MNIITNKDQVFYFCKKEYHEKEKDNVPEDDIAYYGWSNNMNLDFGSYIRGYKYAQKQLIMNLEIVMAEIIFKIRYAIH